jgi:hypothetical protein
VAANFGESNLVNAVLADPVEEYGLKLVEPDKKLRAASAKAGGSNCLRFKRAGTNEIFAVFRIDPSFKNGRLSNVTATVEFFDSTYGSIELEYDGNDWDVPDRSEKGKLGLVVYDHGEYTLAGEKIVLGKTLQWKTESFSLKDVRFHNSQHGDADFRLKANAPELILRKITLEREKPRD